MRVAVLASGVLVLVVGTLLYFQLAPQAMLVMPQAMLDRVLHPAPPLPAAPPPPA